MEQYLSFKAKNTEFELFFADDGAVELYDKNNPRDGFIFENKSSLLMFVNTLTDVLEKTEMEKI